MIHFKQRKARTTGRGLGKGIGGNKDEKPKKRPVAALSFDEDNEEEEDVFEVKSKAKSKEKRRRRMAALAAAADAETGASQPAVVPASVRTGEYTSEKMAELRQSTTFLAPVSAPVKDTVMEEAAGREEATGGRVDRDGDVEMDEDEVEEIRDSGGPEDLRSSVQMSQSMVDMAKRKRARMRQLGGQEDFIPLGEDREMTSNGFGVEEDGGAVGVDEQNAIDVDVYAVQRNKISFGDPGRSDDRQQRLKTLHELQLEQEDELSEEDEEVRKWEEQRMQQGAQLPKGSKERRKTSKKKERAKGGQATLRATGPKLVARTMEEFAVELAGEISKVDEVVEMKKSQLALVEKKLVKEEKEVSDMEQTLQDVAGQFRFFQYIRDYVRDLMGCTDHFMPQLIALETKMMDVYEDLQDEAKRRMEDHAKYAQALIAKGDVTEADMATGVVDDMGRDSGSRAFFDVQEELRKREERRRRLAEVKDRRQHRHLAWLDEPTGFSSDEELEEDNGFVLHSREAEEELRREREEVEGMGRDLFAEVADEFCHLEDIRTVFDTWRTTFSDSYQSLYCIDSLAEVFGPFVRAQVMLWRPTEDRLPLWLQGAAKTGGKTSSCFTEMEWYESLTHDLNEGDEMWKVVTKLVKDEVGAGLKHAIAAVWDPLSRKQTKNLQRSLDALSLALPPDSGVVDTCRLLVLSALKDVSGSLVLPQVPHNALPHQMQCAERLLFRHVKLVGIVCSFGDFLPADSIGPVVNDLIHRVCDFCSAPSLRNGMTLLDSAVELLPLREVTALGGAQTIIRAATALSSQDTSRAQTVLKRLQQVKSSA